MGLCFSCSKSKDRFRDKGQKICGHLQSAVSPLHISHETAACSTICCNGHSQNHVSTIGGGGITQLYLAAPLAAPLPKKGANRHQHPSPCPSQASLNMATSFSNMNITNPIKGLVSKRRNRYKKDGFDLDLTYITDNIIAMGYPASKIEGVYRNHIDDVVKFLDSKHKDHYYIYNLCSERCYDRSKFHNRVEIFPFDDHNPPKLEIMRPFCDSVHKWLTQHPENVAVVHCKAGKGRTGTMICCYLLHSHVWPTADEALNYYGSTRTQDKKGVTIPSQVRYVKYYEKMINNNLTYTPVSMYVKDIILQPVPLFPPGSTVYFKLYTHGTSSSPQQCKMLHKSEPVEIKRGDTKLMIALDVCVPLTGDIKVEFCVKSLMLQKTKKFHLWFNTFFVEYEQSGELNGFIIEQNGGSGICGGSFGSNGKVDKAYVMSFKKNEIDTIHKCDKQNKVYSADFVITLFLQKIPRSDNCPPSYVREAPSSLQDTPNESSESSEEYSNDEDDWDSGESNYLLKRPSLREHE